MRVKYNNIHIIVTINLLLALTLTLTLTLKLISHPLGEWNTQFDNVRSVQCVQPACTRTLCIPA